MWECDHGSTVLLFRFDDQCNVHFPEKSGPKMKNLNLV